MEQVFFRSGAKPPYKVVIVDDSLTARRWISSVIVKDARLDIVGMAASAEEARAVIKATNPDVITLDVEMPGMNGFDFLERLMRLRPMPVVMLATALRDQTSFVDRAMALGAVDCIAKPGFPVQSSMDMLCDRLVIAARMESTSPAKTATAPRQSRYKNQILLIGASTGGVTAIETLLQSLPTDIPPIVIAQHMPQQFLESFVQRLNQNAEHDVDFAAKGMQLAPGSIRVAPSQEMQTCVTWHSGAWHIENTARRYDHTFCPSVNVLFASGVAWARQVGAIILTGLGNDGAQGMLALRRNGARTIAQSKESCVIFGMPGAALALNATEQTAPVEQIAPILLERMLEPSDTKDSI